MPNQYSPDGGASFGSFTPSTFVWLKSYGAIHGAKSAKMRKTTVMATPAIRIHRARPLVFQIWRRERAHQYLTRGSTSALMMSTARLTSTTIRAKNVTRPCTAM